MSIFCFLIGILTGVFALNHLKKSTSEELNDLFWPTLMFKLAAGFSFGLVYTLYFEGGDTTVQFAQAAYLTNLFFDSPNLYISALFGNSDQLLITEPRTLFFTKIISLFCIVSLNNYWITTLALTIFSFSTSWLLVRRLSEYFLIDRTTLLLAFFLLPSVAFWTSGIVKETISFGCMSLFLWAFTPFFAKQKISTVECLIGVLSWWVLFELKYYHAAALLVLCLPLVFFKLLNNRFNRKIAVGLSALIGVISIYLISLFHYNLDLSRILDVVLTNASAYRDSDYSKRLTFAIEPTIYSVLLHYPQAIVGGLFRPFVWEAWNSLSFMVALENSVLLFLILFTLYKYSWKLISVEAVFMVLYVALLSGMLAISTPNFGTLARYKVAFLPILVLLLSPGVKILVNSKKIRRST